jgi:hypothetical protein
MELHLNSALFHVFGPCAYHVFQDFIYGLEEQENAWWNSPERKIARETGQIALFPGDTLHVA